MNRYLAFSGNCLCNDLWEESILQGIKSGGANKTLSRMEVSRETWATFRTREWILLQLWPCIVDEAFPSSDGTKGWLGGTLETSSSTHPGKIVISLTFLKATWGKDCRLPTRYPLSLLPYVPVKQPCFPAFPTIRGGPTALSRSHLGRKLLKESLWSLKF